MVAASFASNLSDGVQLAVVPLLALTISDSPLGIGAIAIARVVSSVALTAPLGVVADRYDRFVTGSIANAIRAMVMIAIVAVMGAGLSSIGLLMAAAALLGVGETLFETSSSAVIPEVVPAARLQRYNSFISFGQTFANGVVGPVLGAALFSVDHELSLLVTTALLVTSGGLLALGIPRGIGRGRPERTVPVRDTPAPRFLSDVAAGIRAVRARRAIVALLILTAGWNFFGWMPEGPLVIFVTRELGGTEGAFAFLLVTTALGSLVGSALGGFVGRRTRTAVLWGATPLYGLGFISVYFLHDLWAIGAVFFVQGLPLMMWAITATTLRQRLVDNDVLGRVNSIFYGSAVALGPLGMGVGSLLAAVSSARTTFIVSGFALLLVGLAVAVVSNGQSGRSAAVELDRALGPAS
ncbi:MAG: MFS transporter [Leifsonia sp.]